MPLLNAAYLLSLHWQSDPALPSSLTEQAGLEILMLGGLLEALRHGRYPTGVEIFRLPSSELLLSILLAWLFAALLLGLVLILLSKLAARFAHPRILADLLTCIVIATFLLPVAVDLLPTSSSARIQVHSAESRGSIQPHEFSQGGEIEMQQPGFFAMIAQKLVPLQPSLIRLDHVFDYYNLYTIGPDGQAHYDWSGLDHIIDAVLSSGAKPLICLSYLPPALAAGTPYGPPTDWSRWEELIYQTVYHLNVERHLNIQYWEVWNEPNTALFWTGTLDDYLRLYETTVHGALRADPSIKIGGPATLSLQPESAFALPFYEQNWINSLAQYTKDHQLPLDFVSWHYYESRPDRFAWSVQLHQRWLADAGVKPELLITEWNRTGGWDPSLDTEETAAYTAAVLTTLADSPVQQAFFFEPFDSSRKWEGAWGMIRADQTIKPVYYAFQLASSLTGTRIVVQSDHGQVGGLATRNNVGLHLLLWNIKPAPVSVQITIDGLQPSQLMNITISGVDAEHGNNYRSGGSSGLAISSGTGQGNAQGQWETTLEMPASSVRLIELR